MTTYYVGPGGSDANAGTSWSARKLTLNGCEDIPVAAGDTVYVGPGTYRETLTVDVSGTAGNPITYIGDYTGANTDGVGGVVRITGSDNDQTATRAQCVNSSSKDYRTFKGFLLDTATTSCITNAGGSNWIIDQNCLLPGPTSIGILVSGTGTTNALKNLVIYGANGRSISFTHTVTVDNTANTVDNIIFIGSAAATGIGIDRIGGITVRNSIVYGLGNGIRIVTALAVGQTLTVNNCQILDCLSGLQATTTAEYTENYNNLYGNSTNRTNVNVGANSVTYPPLFDSRWAFQLMYAQNPYAQVISPFDLASFSQLVNLAGTSPTTTDLRGTAVQGAQREWGALEYNALYKIKGGAPPTIIGSM